MMSEKNCKKGEISLYCKRKLEQIQDISDPKMPYVGIFDLVVGEACLIV
mgnify:CR=1 FL=1